MEDNQQLIPLSTIMTVLGKVIEKLDDKIKAEGKSEYLRGSRDSLVIAIQTFRQLFSVEEALPEESEG